MTDAMQSSLTRRSFIVGTAAVGTGLTVGACLDSGDGESAIANSAPSPDAVPLEWQPRFYVNVGADNLVTVICKHTEMGQGIYTGMATVIAEELDAAWEQMRVESAPANVELYQHLGWGDQSTGGSSSLANSYDQLRQVGAAVRHMLVAAAAETWNVPVTEIDVSGGVVSHEEFGHSASFGELADSAAQQTVPETVVLKPPGEYRLTDSDLLRVDVVDKTNGSAQFTQDLQLPGMLTAVVAHPPRFGGVLKSFAADSARSVSGVVDIVEIPTGVAVIAKDFWSATKARELLSVEWDETNAFKKSSSEIVDDYRAMAATEGAIAREDGSITDGFANADREIAAEFNYPYLAHAPLEPLNCAVQLTAGKCEIWSGAQMQTLDQHNAAALLDIAPEQVEINTLMAGGAYGRRACNDYVAEAVNVAKTVAMGTPVKLVRTREDDMRAAQYRPLNYHHLRAGIDADGNLTAWHHRLVGQSIAKLHMPSWIENGVDGMSVGGASNWLYRVPNIKVETHSPDLPIPVLWYRGVGATHALYTVETFIDEIAALTGKDPLEYRLKMLEHEQRMTEVTRIAATQAGWGSDLGAGRGRGIAICKLRGTYMAQVAEVTVHGESFSVDRVVTAVDCGRIVNPDIVRAQLEGGTGFGLSAVLGDQITLKDGYVEQENFNTYKLLRINQMPEVDVHMVESVEPPSGVGELAAMPVGAAVANALYTVTGKRYRSLPLKLDA